MTTKRIDGPMEMMHPTERYRWCEFDACCCLGCANVSGGLLAKKVTHEQWLDWVVRHDRRSGTEDRRRPWEGK